MGHVGHFSDGGGGAPAGRAGAGHTASAAERGVRRGAVRAKVATPGVEASNWEHVEVAVNEADPDLVSSLQLLPDGAFRAEIREQPQGSRAAGGTTPRLLAVAAGTWRRCRGGVELRFAEGAEGLDLPELIVEYRSRRRDCLVACEAGLPDGLAQEYTLCRDSDCAGTAGVSALALPAPAAGAPAEVLLSETTAKAPLPIGLIEEGSSGSDEENDREFAAWCQALPAAGKAAAPRAAATTTPAVARPAAEAPPRRAAAAAAEALDVDVGDARRSPAEAGASTAEAKAVEEDEEDLEEEYVDDFEASSELGDCVEEIAADKEGDA